MLRNISVENFKSIGRTVDIELAPLSIVTGANSSGKSSLLQCLLVLLQTFRHSSPERQLILNGPLTQLGDFEDILNDSAAERAISIGLTIAPTAPADDTPQALIRRTRVPVLVEALWTFSDKPLRSDVSSNESKTFPSLSRLCLKSFFESADDYQPFQLNVKRHAWSNRRRVEVEGYSEALPESLVRSLSWSLSSEPKVLGSDIRGAQFDHCLPTQFTSRYDLRQEIARRIIDELSTPTRSTQIPSDYPVFRELWEIISEVIADTNELPPVEDVLTMREVRNWLRQRSPVARRRFIQQMEFRGDEILRRYAKMSTPEPWLFSHSMPEPWARSTSAVKDSILSLRYLGPLRAQPAPIYPVATTLGAEDVGPSGEWTAAVLDTYREKSIEFVPPSAIPIQTTNVPTIRATLLEAVTMWMQYLGVAFSVSTTDRGSLGHELTVSNDESGRRVPLTHVGVGVSQCLPVVVTLLLAPKDSMTLLEQPELHLHPAVQSKLGDFLLAMTVSGRQCLVETHSEYLINRLRLRIAESEGVAVRDQIGLYYTEEVDRSTKFEKVDVNEYGSVISWPKGFFDETQDDIERLMTASHRKRVVNARDN